MRRLRVHDTAGKPALKFLVAGVSCDRYAVSEQAGALDGRMTAATDVAGDRWFARDESGEINSMRTTNGT